MANRIKELRLARRLSAKRLADLVGTSPSQIVKLERGERRLTQDWMERIGAHLGCPATALMDAGWRPTEDSGFPALKSDGAAETEPYGGSPPAPDAKDLPVFGAAKGGPDSLFFDNGQVFEFVRRPGVLAGVKNAYAVYVVGESMAPRFELGEMVYVNPNRPLNRGCYVVVELRSGEGMIKRFVKQTTEDVLLEQFNPPQEIALHRRHIKSLHRIVGLTEHP